MPGMNSTMLSKVQMCTICHKQECCKSSFKDIAQALRFDYILTEYSSLSDAWRVYQGVALYREYRGISGETKQLDVEPKPCQLCMVKIVNMAQAVYVVTSTVEAGVASKREVGPSRMCVSPPATISTPQHDTQKPKLSPPNQPGTVKSRERWSTDSKERWSTSPVKKQSDGQANGHTAASKDQVPVNQALQPQIKVAAKSQVNKNRRESPLTKSKEAATIKSRDIQNSLSASKECQTPTQSNSRPKRSGRSFLDRNPDFHTDISPRGEVSETDSLDGVLPISATPAKKPKKQITPLARNEESARETLIPDSSNTVTSVPALSESRPKRSTGRSLFERNPDFAMDIPFSKVVEQKVSQKENDAASDSDKNRKVINEKKSNECVKDETDGDSGVLEVVIKPWKSEDFRAEHLAKLDHALSSAGWSQAIRSGKNMEKEVFKNSSSEAEYVAGITRLVAHFNRGNTGVKSIVNTESACEKSAGKQISGNIKNTSGHQKQIGTNKAIKSGNGKIKTETSKLGLPKSHTVLKERRAVKPTKKIREKNTNVDNSKVVKKVTKTWSKTKVNCPMCGQLKLKTKMKEHILVFHKSSPEFPCIDCEFKSTTKTELGNHIKTVHEDLNPEGSVSESEGSVTSQKSTSSASEARGRANAVRSQFQYIVKTSKSGKQGRKYIQVGSDGGSGTDVPDVTTSELKSEIKEIQAARKTPKAKKVITPGSKLVKSSEDDSVKHNGVLQYMKEDEKSRVHEVVHEASVSEKVIDEFAGSSSESEFSEPRSQVVGTLNAYYMNKNCPDEEDVSGLKIDSVASVPPVKSTIDVKDNIVDDKNGDSINNQENVNNTTRKENMIPNNERPQRRKRSIEDIHPDFVMDMPRSGQKSDKHLKKGKQEIEEIEVSSVAKNWFEVNQGDEF